MKEKKERILEAALIEFCENGISKTKVSNIAERAGVGHGTVFNYFNSKDDLAKELYIYCKENFINSLKKNVGQQMDYREKLRTVYFNILKYFRGNPDQYKYFNLASILNQVDEETKEKGYAIMLDEFGAFVREGIEKGVIKKMDEKYLLSLFYKMASANVEYICSYPEKNNPDFIEKTFDLMIDTIFIKK